MKTEIEVKFCDIDIDAMREILARAGAVCEEPMRLMKRALIEEPHHAAEDSFLRIRDEGDKVTLTFKRRANPDQPSIDNTTEIEVIVSSFDDTVELFREAGWTYKTFQESKRETWKLGTAEVVIDEWPWLPPYIEIEAASEEEVRTAAAALGLDWSAADYGHIDAVYQKHYTFADGFRGVIDLKEVRFGDPIPKEFEVE
ncbi:MAG: CYTH domain-containing protein [Candidatus Saccharimonas sp.]